MFLSFTLVITPPNFLFFIGAIFISEVQLVIPKNRPIQSKAETFNVGGHNSLFRPFWLGNKMLQQKQVRAKVLYHPSYGPRHQINTVLRGFVGFSLSN